MRGERKTVEMLFAHLKCLKRLNRLQLCGLNGARDEFHLAAAAQNLRKLTKISLARRMATARGQATLLSPFDPHCPLRDEGDSSMQSPKDCLQQPPVIHMRHSARLAGTRTR